MYEISVEKIKDAWFAVALDKDGRIVASGFSCKGREDILKTILHSLPFESSFSETKPDSNALNVLRNMVLIYEGKPADNKFSLNMDRLPLFTRKVLLLTFKIPRGYVATYGGIAEALGDKSAARAVGNVEAANPFSPIVPCHRVVASNLGLGGYGGGLDVKRALLKREGVTLTGDRVSSEHLWSVE